MPEVPAWDHWILQHTPPGSLAAYPAEQMAQLPWPGTHHKPVQQSPQHYAPSLMNRCHVHELSRMPARNFLDTPAWLILSVYNLMSLGKMHTYYCNQPGLVLLQWAEPSWGGIAQSNSSTLLSLFLWLIHGLSSCLCMVHLRHCWPCTKTMIAWQS